MSDDSEKLADKIGQVNLGGNNTQNITFLQNPPLNIPECPTNIKPPSNKIKFVGREKDVENIHQTLQIIEKPLAITAVAGMSGVGKSELALQYAHEYKAEYPGGVCWLSASQGQSSVLTDLVQFMLSKFQVRVPDDAKDWSDVDIAQYFWDQWRTPGNILVIFDDVKNYGDIEGLLPNNKRFQVLLTTQIDFSASGHVDSYSLEVLKREKSLELLEKSFIGKERLSAEAETADQLCAYLGDLPLGLVLAGQYLKESPKLPLIKYWERLQNTKIDHLSLNPDPKNVIRDERTKRGVIAAFQLTWQRIGEIDPKSQELAGYFSLYALAPIPFTIDYDDPSAEDKEQTFNTLLEWHILSPSDQYENSYKLHNLMREFLQNKLAELSNGEELKQLFVGQMISVAKQIESTVTNDIIKTVSPYIEHITEVANNYLEYLKIDFIQIYYCLVLFYRGQNSYVKAEYWCNQFCYLVKIYLPADHPGIAISYMCLAEVDSFQGRYKKAESLLLKAIKILEKNTLLYEVFNSNLGVIYNNLANLYKDQAKYQEAEFYYLKAITLDENYLPEDHSGLATDYGNLAGLYLVQGKYKEAEIYFLKVMCIKANVLPPGHPDLSVEYNNLANLYTIQGKYEEAQIYLLKVKATIIDQASLPENHHDLATYFNALGGLYYEKGNYEEAKSCFLKAIKIDEKSLPENHPDRAIHLNNLGGLYYAQGKYEDAEPFYLRAIDIKEKSLPADHPSLANSYNNLAALYYSQGKYEDAEPLFIKTFEISMNKLGIEHPNTQTVKNNLIKFWQKVIAEGRAGELKLLHEHPLGQWVLENRGE